MILRKKAWRDNVRIAWDSPVNWPSGHAFGPYGPIAIRHRCGTGNPAAGPADTELRCPHTRGPLPCHDGQHHIKYVPYMQIITRAELTSLLSRIDPVKALASFFPPASASPPTRLNWVGPAFLPFSHSFDAQLVSVVHLGCIIEFVTIRS
jgi:hypothetical protein